MPYRLSQKILSSEADDVLHGEHPTEACNTDDTQHDEAIDDETAAALASMSNARLCRHCFKDGTFA